MLAQRVAGERLDFVWREVEIKAGLVLEFQRALFAIALSANDDKGSYN